LHDALGRLTSAGLVLRRGLPPQATFTFKHALVQDTAYSTLLRDRRRQLHNAIACALEERLPNLVVITPELLAHHLTEAGEAERAALSWLDAGRRAAQRSADREAVGHLRRGLAALASLPASAERDRTELEIQVTIGTPLIALHGWSGDPVAAAYERAATLCEGLGNDHDQLGPTLFGLASNRVVRGQTRDAQRLAERCRAVAEQRRSPVDRLLAHRAMGAALMQLGELGQARAELDAISTLYDPERDCGLASRCVTDPLTSGLSFLALVLWVMGHPDQAQRAADEASRRAAQLQHANTAGHVLCHAGGERAQLLRDAPAVRGYADAALALAAEHDMPMWRGYGLVLRGWALAEEGRLEDGALLVQQGVSGLDALGTVFHRSHQLGILAGIRGRLGDPAEGLRLVQEALEDVARTEVRLFEAELRRQEGELGLLAGDAEARVEVSFSEALAVARRQKAKSIELRAALTLRSFGATRVATPKPATSSRRSTAGSPKASTRPI
jgi:predicted ATPase